MATEFNREFIERRMAEHKRIMHAAEHRLIQEIIDEVMSLPRRPQRTSLSFDFEAHDFRRKELRHVGPVNA
jgi:hypothetical protein